MRCCLLTRLSCSRAGARLSTRGIDTEGRVAVFAETEQIISILEEGILASFIQVICCCCCCCCLLCYADQRLSTFVLGTEELSSGTTQD